MGRILSLSDRVGSDPDSGGSGRVLKTGPADNSGNFQWNEICYKQTENGKGKEKLEVGNLFV